MAVSGSKKPKNQKRERGCNVARVIYNFTRRNARSGEAEGLEIRNCDSCERNAVDSESTGRVCCPIHGYRQAPIIDCKDFYPK